MIVFEGSHSIRVNPGTLYSYVADIFDANGNRYFGSVGRIQGDVIERSRELVREIEGRKGG